MAEKTVTFELRVNERDLERGLRSAVNSAGKLDNSVTRIGSVSSRSFAQFTAGASGADSSAQALNRSLQNMIARIGSVTAMAAFGKEIISVRSEFQALDITIEALLQNGEKARKLSADLVELAATTPLQLLDLSQGAKQLIAYGVAAEDIIDTLTRLGNITTGLKLPLERLTYLYGTTMTQGRLMARDMIQFTTSGIPLLQTLADMYGKTTDQINDMVTAGQIGADEVKEAIHVMTDEGGKFYKINEKLSEATMVAISNLKDRLQIAMNEMGESNQGFINDSIAAVSYLVEHYESILDVLVPLIATYGAYKAAVIATAAAQRVIASAESIAAFLSLTKQIRSAKDAMLLLNMATKASTIGLIVGAIGGLIAVISRFNKKAKEAAQAQEDLLAPMRQEVTTVNTLVSKINNSNIKEGERIELLNQLKRINPDIVTGIENEANAQEILTKRLEDYNRTKMAEIALKSYSIDSGFEQSASDLSAAREKLESEQTKLINTYTTIFTRYQGLLQSNAKIPVELKTLFDSVIASAIPENEKIEALFSAYRAIEDKVKAAAGSYTGSDWHFASYLFAGLDINKYERSIKKLDKATDEYNEKSTQLKDKITQTATAMFGATDAANDFVAAQMEIYFPKAAADPPATKVVTSIKEAIQKAKENIQKFEAELKKLRETDSWEGDEKSFIAAIESKEAELKAAKDAYESLTGIDLEKLAKAAADKAKKEQEEQKKANKEYNDWLAESSRKANEEMIDLQLKQEKERVDAMADGAAKRKAQFSLEQKERLSVMQKYVRDVVDEQSKLAKNQGKSAGYGNLEVGVDGTLAYNLAKSGLTPTSEQQAVINKMVQNWNQQIIDTWVKETTTLDLKSGYNLADDLIEKLDAEMIAGIAKGGFDPLKQQASMIFADISELSSDMIQQIITNAEEYLKTPELTDEAVAEYRRAIDKANEYLVENNPWEAIKVAQERYVKAIADYNKAKSDYDEAKQAGDIIKQNKAIGEQNAAILEQAGALSTIRKAYEGIGSIIREFTGFGFDVAEIFGIDGEILSGVEQMLDGTIKLSVGLSDLITKTQKVGKTAVDATTKIAEATEATGEGVAKVGGAVAAKGGGMAGAIIAIVGAIIQIGSAVVQVVQVVKQQKIEKFLEGVQIRLDNIANTIKSIATMPGLGDSFLTEDLFNRVARFNKALIVLQRSMMEFMGTYPSNKTDDLYKTVEKVIGLMLKVPAFHGLSVTDSVFGNVDIQQMRETLAYLQGITEAMKDSKEKGWAQEAIGYIEQYIEYYEQLRDVLKDMLGDISSNVLSTVNSMWKEIREGGETTFADLTAAAKKNISEVIDEMVSQQLWAATMGTYFDQLGEDLAGAILNGGETSDILAVFDTFWANMDIGLKEYTKDYELFLSTAEQHGWDMSSGTKNDGTTEGTDTTPAKDSIKGMREELSKLKEQWESLTAEQRESEFGKNLFGDIKDLEDKIEAAESLYDVNKDIEGSINDINANLSRLEDEWNAMSEAQRKGAEGLKNREDKTFYEGLLAEAQAVQETELERLQSLVESSEAKYELYQKWVELYGKETADQMMGSMLGDAEAYLSDLKNGIATLSAKVKDGTATDEEIAQLTQWEQTVADIYNAAAEAAATASQKAYDSWNSSLSSALSSADTDYERLIAYQDAYNQLLTNTEMSAEDLAAAIEDTEENIANLQDQIYKNLYDQYKTPEMEQSDTIEQYKRDIEYLEKNGYNDLADAARKKLAEYVSEIAVSGLEATDEYKAIFSDLTEISVVEAQRALDAYREMVSSSDELTQEQKDEILSSLDDIQDKIDGITADNIKQQFSDIQNIIESITSVLSDLGVSEDLVNSINGISTLIGGISQIALSGGNIVSIIMGIAQVIKGVVSSIKNLTKWLKGEENSTESLDRLTDAYERLGKAANYAAGEQRRALYEQQQENINARLTELQNLIGAESSKKKKWWDLLGLFSEDADQELIQKWSDEYNDLIELQAELMSSRQYDFLLTDFESFSKTIANIVKDNISSVKDIFAAVDQNSEEFVQNLLTNFLRVEMLEEPIRQLMQNLFVDSGSGALLNYEALQEFKNKIADYSGNFYDALRAAYEAMGYDMTKINDNQLKSSATSASEETVNAVVGLLNAVNMRQAENLIEIRKQGEIATESLALQQSINETVTEVAKDVAEIRKNTGFIERIYRILNNNAGDLFNSGIQL